MTMHIRERVVSGPRELTASEDFQSLLRDLDAEFDVVENGELIMTARAVRKQAREEMKTLLKKPENLEFVRGIDSYSQILSLIDAAKRRMKNPDWEIEFIDELGEINPLSGLIEKDRSTMHFIAIGIHNLFDKFDANFLAKHNDTVDVQTELITSENSIGSGSAALAAFNTAVKGQDLNADKPSGKKEIFDRYRLPIINLALCTLGVVPFKSRQLVDFLKFSGTNSKAAIMELR